MQNPSVADSARGKTGRIQVLNSDIGNAWKKYTEHIAMNYCVTTEFTRLFSIFR